MKRWFKWLFLLLTVLLCIGGGLFLWQSGFFASAGSQESLRAYIEDFSPYSHLCFFLIQFLSVILAPIPSNLSAAAGGMLFGPLTGSLLSFAAATLASSLSFLIARWLGRDLLQRYVGHTTVFQAIERGIARSGCDFLILTRLVPLFPYNIQNYAYGLTAIRFWPFTLISAVTTLPGLVIYSVMASELAREGVTLAFALKLSLAGGLLFALVQIGKRFARARRVAACSEEVRHDPT